MSEAVIRRAHLRYCTGGSGRWIPSAPGAPMEFRLLDVSLGGIGFRSAEKLPPGTRGLLRFSVFCEGRSIKAESAAEACYCILESGGYRIGVKFVDPNEATLKALKFIVQARSKVAPGY